MNPRLPLLLCLVRVQLEKIAWGLVIGLLLVGFFTVLSPFYWEPLSVIITMVTLWIAAAIYWPRGMRAQAEYEATLPVGRVLANAARVLALLCAVLLIVGCWGICYYNGNLLRAAHWLGEHLTKPNMFADYYRVRREPFEQYQSMADVQRNTGLYLRTVFCLAWYSALALAVVLKLTRWWRVFAALLLIGIVVLLANYRLRWDLAYLLADSATRSGIMTNVVLNVLLISLLVFPRRVR